MKQIIISCFIVLIVGVPIPRVTQAQGTITYLSNLGQSSAGSLAVGSDSWLAENFFTGNNANGYTLDSIQLGMSDASSNSSGFTVLLYSSIPAFGPTPGGSLDNLNGSTDPATGGIFNYTPTSTITLLPHTDYFIVLTAGTPIANGAYEWSFVNSSSYSSTGGWAGADSILFTSQDGLSWTGIANKYSQYAINATAIPEPSSSFLLLLGSGVFIYVRRNKKPSKV
jgi:hypothetical protein